jgi:hypothetical protein
MIQSLKESVRSAVARGWCSQANEDKEMDADLASAIFSEVWTEVAAHVHVEGLAQGLADKPVAWRVDGVLDGNPQIWFYYKPEWPVMHEKQGDTVTPLYAATPAERSPDRAAWLCELNGREGPRYFQISDDDDWTANHDQALQLATREAAERVISYYGWTEVKAIEHMWCKPKCSSPAANDTLRSLIGRLSDYFRVNAKRTDSLAQGYIRELDALIATWPSQPDIDNKDPSNG